MKKLGTSALVLVAALAVSSLSLGCQKEPAKPAAKPAPAGGNTGGAGNTGGGTGGGTEKPAGGGH